MDMLLHVVCSDSTMAETCLVSLVNLVSLACVAFALKRLHYGRDLA
jgi:hypothetical protein